MNAVEDGSKSVDEPQRNSETSDANKSAMTDFLNEGFSPEEYPELKWMSAWWIDDELSAGTPVTFNFACPNEDEFKALRSSLKLSSNVCSQRFEYPEKLRVSSFIAEHEDDLEKLYSLEDLDKTLACLVDRHRLRGPAEYVTSTEKACYVYIIVNGGCCFIKRHEGTAATTLKLCEEELLGRYTNCIVETFHLHRAIIRVKLEVTDEYSREHIVRTHNLKACQGQKSCLNCAKPGRGLVCQLSGYERVMHLGLSTQFTVLYPKFARDCYDSGIDPYRLDIDLGDPKQLVQKVKEFLDRDGDAAPAFMFRHLPWHSLASGLNSTRLDFNRAVKLENDFIKLATQRMGNDSDIEEYKNLQRKTETFLLPKRDGPKQDLQTQNFSKKKIQFFLLCGRDNLARVDRAPPSARIQAQT